MPAAEQILAQSSMNSGKKSRLDGIKAPWFDWPEMPELLVQLQAFKCCAIFILFLERNAFMTCMYGKMGRHYHVISESRTTSDASCITAPDSSHQSTRILTADHLCMLRSTCNLDIHRNPHSTSSSREACLFQLHACDTAHSQRPPFRLSPGALQSHPWTCPQPPAGSPQSCAGSC